MLFFVKMIAGKEKIIPLKISLHFGILSSTYSNRKRPVNGV